MALALTAMIIGAVTLLHAYVLRGLGTATSHYSNLRQTQQLLDAIDEVATQAQSYSITTVNGKSCLKLIMPATCSDTDNDGLYDTCVPARISKHGLEEWGQGNRVWFYPGNSLGVPADGGQPSVAVVSDDSIPSNSTNLASFSTYPNGKPKFPNVDSLSWAPLASDSFSVTLTASSNNGELTERKVVGVQDNNLKDSYSVTRIIFTARWRS